MTEGVPAPRYPCISLDVSEDAADEVSAALFELGALGVEQRDDATLIHGARPGAVTLVASFESHDDARAALVELQPEHGARLEEVVGDAWRDEWKKHFEPFRICDGIVVRPPWRAFDPQPGERVLVLEPGRAFGTGLHETTALVAALLAERRQAVCEARVLDVGCGSGVLSLVALALGAAFARAIDIDPEAVAVTRENAARNRMESRVAADATPVSHLSELYPVVVANIEAKPLVDLANALSARVAPGGLLFLSGILATRTAAAQWSAVRDAYGALEVEHVAERGEWLAAVLRA